MRRLTLAVVALAAFAIIPACGSDFAGDPTTPATSDGGADVIDGGGDAATDPCIDTPTDPKCLSESTALFVSSGTGNDQDAAAGTRDKPFKTIGAALKKIDQAKRRIYVCEGTYPEDVALTAAHSQLSIFGGVDCTWNAAPAIKPVIGASANPFKTDGTTALALADLAIQAKDAATGSSIAMFVSGGEVTLKGVRLVAGNGLNGDDGALSPYTFPTAVDLRGNDALNLVTGGGQKAVQCPDGATTTGGKGGDLGKSGATGTPGTPNPGTLSNCTSNVNGQPGTQPAAAIGAKELGALADGWEPMAGADGAAGVPGQGGGGGYGNSGGGGGGGAGACGGAGGKGGRGGGASIALAASSTRLTVIASVLEAKDGGSGGAGVAGQPGQAVGGAGGNRSDMACNGGNGGSGGDGASGGGGAGGVSVGILYKGGKPTFDPATEQAIKVGKKGAAGPAAPSATNAGIEGVAATTLEAK